MPLFSSIQLEPTMSTSPTFATTKTLSVKDFPQDSGKLLLQKTHERPLKINAWKTYFLLEMVPFRGDVSFLGVYIVLSNVAQKMIKLTKMTLSSFPSFIACYATSATSFPSLVAMLFILARTDTASSWRVDRFQQLQPHLPRLEVASADLAWVRGKVRAQCWSVDVFMTNVPPPKIRPYDQGLLTIGFPW